jgi:peroxiredoxin/tetratricopeptide (TPR) repeat protein
MRALALCLLLAQLTAQDDPRGPGHSRHGEPFDEGPRQAASLLPGLGTAVHLPVAGLAADAQALFDQGVTQLHGFWYFEAERSFRQVNELHPGCAMAYWGMAMANVENKPRAAGLIGHAVACSAAAPRREQVWIDAWASYYRVDDGCRLELRSGDPGRVLAAAAALVEKNKKRDDEKVLGRKLVQDLERLVFEFPDDIEGKAFLAVQNWLNYDWGGGIPISSHAGIDALLAQVFAKAPLHPAHHYRIHLWDAEAPERALGSAARIGDSAPGIAHQWHMAGHIYRKLHRHGEAAWQQEASARVDHEHMRRHCVMPFLIHNYGHNQEWLSSSLSWLGSMNRALDVARNLAELPRHPAHNSLDEDRDIASYARARLVQVCEDHELWQEARRLCDSGHLDRTDSVKGEAQRLGLLGRASFRLGRLDEAEAVVAEAEALLVRARAQRAAAVDKAEAEAHGKRESGDKVTEAMAEAGREGTDTVRSVLDLLRELRGERLLAAGDAKAALAEFEAVKGFPKTLLADAWMAAGEPQKAIDLLESEVEERPNRFPTAARLLLALRAAAKPEQETRLAELQSHLQGDRYSIEVPYHGGFASRTGLIGEVGVGDLRLPVADEEQRRLAAFPPDFGERPPLESLGQLTWEPFPNAGFSLPWVGRQDGPSRAVVSLASDGTTTRRDAFDDSGTWNRPVLVVFYLGFGCLHCMEQLRALSRAATDFAAAGVDVVAIGNDALESATASLDALSEAERFPFPLLADPALTAFRAWRCHDDFEDMPLHGTFLVDAEGRVRWADVSAQPFTQFAWLVAESRRLLALSGAGGAR